MASIGEARAQIAECVDKATVSDAFLGDASGTIEQALGAFNGIIQGSENTLSTEAGNVLSGEIDEIEVARGLIRAAIAAAEALSGKL